MGLSPLLWTGRALRYAGNAILKRFSLEGVWIDVGAHYGEATLHDALCNAALTVYAFEPNLQTVATLLERASRCSNYIVVPMAVAEQDGHAELHVNQFDAASSLLPMDENSRRSWIGGEALVVDSIRTVPTTRLDTFMDLMRIKSVEYLKIDAQGMDFAVLKSAGSRLRDVAKIVLEVDVSPQPLYVGSGSKQEMVAFLKDDGFELVQAEKQTHNQEENLTFVRVE